MASSQRSPARATRPSSKPKSGGQATDSQTTTNQATTQAGTAPAESPVRQQPLKVQGDPAAALAQKASEAAHLREFIDRTTFSGNQRDAGGELSSVDQHPADIADQTMQREVDYTIKGIVADEVQQVEQAMRRQAEGRYGICDGCGQEIDPERLAVRPQATLCISCQRQRDEGR